MTVIVEQICQNRLIERILTICNTNSSTR